MGGASTIAAEAGAYTEINGGQYENTRYPTIENRGEMLITGGAFKNTSCSSCSSGWGYTVRSGQSSSGAYLKIRGAEEDGVQVTGVQGGLAVVGGTADIYNGVYETIPCEKHPSGASAFYAGYFTGESYETSTNLYGGTFRSFSQNAIQVGNGNPAPDSGAGEESTVMIYGGTFTGGDGGKTAIVVEQTDHAIGAAKIFGGTFSSDVARYVAEDRAIVQRDGQWVVGTVDQLAVAEVDGVKYTALETAVENAHDGQTVTLLQNVSGQGSIALTSGQSVTVDLNGFDIGFAKNQRFGVQGGSLHITGAGKVYEQMPYYAPVVIVGSDEPVEH